VPLEITSMSDRTAVSSMIYRDKIIAALGSRAADFAQFDTEVTAQYALYRDALERIAALGGAELLARLKEMESPGALPTPEFDLAQAFVVPFGASWSNHEEARGWAYTTLLGRTTFAADGSQILPSKDFSVPVAAVQVAWFENSHTPEGAYVKDVAFDVLPPSEVVSANSPTGVSEPAVHRRRYAAEIDAIRNYMYRAAERGFDPQCPPVVFFDSLLVISFAEAFAPEERQFYVSEITSLLEVSETTGVPIVGYVDNSFARDLAVMLHAASGLPESHKVHDARLISSRMAWGDRTPIFQCARRGILDSYGEKWRNWIGFVYLKTASDDPPARLDIPMWVYERGLLDYVIDTVRGEVIVGGGYPYSIETADSAAVLTMRDRQMFYQVFQEFSEVHNLGLRIARKALSKAHRR
jgi:hypothetical protein